MAINYSKQKWGASHSFLDVNKKVKVSTKSEDEDERNRLASNKHWNEDTVANKLEGQGLYRSCPLASVFMP